MQFSCANPEMSEKARRRLEDILVEEDSKLDFDRHKSNPVPSSMLSENIPIKLNAAAILREGHRYKKQEVEILMQSQQSLRSKQRKVLLMLPIQRWR